MARPDPKGWGQAALGGLLVALGGALFGTRRSAAKTAAKQSPKKAAAKFPKVSGKPGRPAKPRAGRANVRTKARAAEAPAHARYWPPPAPKPIEPEKNPHATGGSGAAHHPVDRTSEKLGHEVKDARAGTIAKVMVVSVSVIAACIAGLFWFVGHSHRRDALSPPLTPQQLAVIVPPGPHLQEHPLHDIAMEKKRESDLLTYYAWTDPSHQAARIPIARAQALVIGRSLDPLPSAGPDPSRPSEPVQAPSAPQP